MLYQKIGRTCCIPKQASLTTIIQRFEGVDMEMSTRYSSLLTMMAVTMIYASGMPLLYFVAAAGFFATYWVDKVGFIKLYKIPARYDHTLNDLMIDWMPLMALVHSAFGFWFFTSPVYLEGQVSENTVLSENLDSITPELLSMGYVAIEDRVTESIIPTICMMVIIFVMECLRVFCGVCSGHFDVDQDLQKNRHWDPELFSEATKKVRFESYHSYCSPHWKPAYLRTESHKQMKVPSDLKHLRLKEVDNLNEARHGGLLESAEAPDFGGLGGGLSGVGTRGISLIPINCPNEECQQPLQVHDTGQPALYTCSKCFANFMM